MVEEFEVRGPTGLMISSHGKWDYVGPYIYYKREGFVKLGWHG